MRHQSIGYHTRLSGNNTVKVCGGGFGGTFDQETIERLTKVHFTVKVKPSGSPVFVDREGREVSLYVTVDPASTDAGKAAVAEWRRVKAAEARAASTCEHVKHGGTECSDAYNCCDCGNSEGNGCGCAYCFSCNACETCIAERGEA